VQAAGGGNRLHSAGADPNSVVLFHSKVTVDPQILPDRGPFAKDCCAIFFSGGQGIHLVDSAVNTVNLAHESYTQQS